MKHLTNSDEDLTAVYEDGHVDIPTFAKNLREYLDSLGGCSGIEICPEHITHSWVVWHYPTTEDYDVYMNDEYIYADFFDKNVPLSEPITVWKVDFDCA